MIEHGKIPCLSYFSIWISTFLPCILSLHSHTLRYYSRRACTPLQWLLLVIDLSAAKVICVCVSFTDLCAANYVIERNLVSDTQLGVKEWGRILVSNRSFVSDGVVAVELANHPSMINPIFCALGLTWSNLSAHRAYGVETASKADNANPPWDQCCDQIDLFSRCRFFTPQSCSRAFTLFAVAYADSLWHVNQCSINFTDSFPYGRKPSKHLPLSRLSVLEDGVIRMTIHN